MMTLRLGRRALFSAAVAAMTIGAPAAFADGHQVVASIYFISLGGAGGARLGTAPVSSTHLTLPTISSV